MSTVIADPAGALCTFLASQLADLLDEAPAGHGMTGAAVFRPQLPEWVDANMDALACIVVRPAGGYKLYSNGLLPLRDPVLDLTCYAGSSQEALTIATAAGDALMQLTQSVWEGVTFYGARIAGGPIPLPDQQTLWPACWIGTQLVHNSIAVAQT